MFKKKKSRRQSSSWSDDLIGDVEAPERFHDASYRKFLVQAIIRGHTFKIKKCKYKKYEDPTYLWVAEDLSKIFYKMGSGKKTKERKAKVVKMKDVSIIYSGPPVLASSADRSRWESSTANACFTMKTTSGFRSLDIEARDVVGNIGQQRRDRWVQAFKMALYLYHYRGKFRDVIADLAVPDTRSIRDILDVELNVPKSGVVDSAKKNETVKEGREKDEVDLKNATKAEESVNLKITVRDGAFNEKASLERPPSYREDSEVSTMTLQSRRRSSGTFTSDVTDESATNSLRRTDGSGKNDVDRPIFLLATDQVAAATAARGGNKRPTRRKLQRRVKDGFDLAFPALSPNDISSYIRRLPDVPAKCMLARKGPFRIMKDYDGIKQMEQLQECIEQFNGVLKSPESLIGNSESGDGPVSFMAVITGLRQVLQAATAPIDKLVLRKSAQKHTSKTQKVLSEYLSQLFAHVGSTQKALKMLAYVAKYRSLDVSNDNSTKRKHSLEKILELIPGILRGLEGDLRSIRFAYSSHNVGAKAGGKEGVAMGAKTTTDDKNVRSPGISMSRSLPPAKMFALGSSRSPGDEMGGSTKITRLYSSRKGSQSTSKPLIKPRRHSQDSTASSPCTSGFSAMTASSVMLDLQRIDKTKRLLSDVKRIAENWIYMLEKVDEEEKSFTKALKSGDTDGDKKGTLALSKDYGLERYALPGIHLPKDMVRLFYNYWIENVKMKDKMSFTRFMLYFPYKTQEDIVNLVKEDRSKFEELCKARIAQGFGKQSVKYYETEAERRKYRVECERRKKRVVLVKAVAKPSSRSNPHAACDGGGSKENDDEDGDDAPRPLLDTKSMETTMSGVGVGMIVFRRPEIQRKDGSGMYVHVHKVNKIHHSTIFAGGAVDFAGELKVSNGTILWLSNKSGHYKPGAEAILEILHYFRVCGVDLSTVPFDVVKGSVPTENLTRIEKPSELKRGRALYWRMPSSLALYFGLTDPSLWGDDYVAFLQKRFPEVYSVHLLKRALRQHRARCIWKRCLKRLRRKQLRQIVERGILAVESYESKIIEKHQLECEVGQIPFECIRVYAGGNEGILAGIREDAGLVWFYLNSKGEPTGPHKSSSMYLWIRRNKIGAGMKISCTSNGPFVSVGSLTARFINFVAIRDLLRRHNDEGGAGA
eukprot:g1859.t1